MLMPGELQDLDDCWTEVLWPEDRRRHVRALLCLPDNLPDNAA